MKLGQKLWGFGGFATVSLLGSLLHFLYGWTDSTVVALFSAVNESTWEHMKLLFFPMMLVAVVQRATVGRACNAFWCVKLRGAVLGLALIPILFYTLRGVFGLTPDWVNILLFFFCAAAVYIYETRRFSADDTPCKAPRLAIILLCVIASAFFVFTYAPPEIPLFMDPISGEYGIEKGLTLVSPFSVSSNIQCFRL